MTWPLRILSNSLASLQKNKKYWQMLLLSVRWNSVDNFVIRCRLLNWILIITLNLSSPSFPFSFLSISFIPSTEVHHMDRICVYTSKSLRQDLPSLMKRRDVPTGVFVWAVRLPHPGSVKQAEERKNRQRLICETQISLKYVRHTEQHSLKIHAFRHTL